MNAKVFAGRLLDRLTTADPAAAFLKVRARGKTAVLGYECEGEWIPLLRVAGGSGAYNVADLQVRHRTSWQPTFTRGVPAVLAGQLAEALRFTWAMHIGEADDC